MRHLTRRGASFVFQMRLPRTIDPDFELSPIRLTLGALSIPRARTIAMILAGLARNRCETKGGGFMSPKQGAEGRESLERMLTRVLPTLLGLDMLDGARLPEDIRLPVTEAVFDGLAQIGEDRASGHGIFAHSQARPEMLLAMALRDERLASAMIGLPASPAPDRAHEDILLKKLEAIEARQETLARQLEPQKDPAQVPSFSEAARSFIEAKRRAHGDDHPEVATLTYRANVFKALAGDRKVDAYTRADLQHVVSDLAWLPANSSKQPGFSYDRLPGIIAQNRERQGTGLAENSILNFVNRIRSIIYEGCADAQVAPSCRGRITVPKRAAPPVQRSAPANEALAKVIAKGIASGILSDAMLVPLGVLTGRRIGALAFMHRENIKQYNGVWVYFPQSHSFQNGRWRSVPFKTNESLRFFVLHNIFADCGFIAWALKAPGPIFPRLLEAKDPADAAQKRMARLYQRAEVDPQLAGTFHSLRAGKIRNDRELRLDARAVRLQVGHELTDVHERYDGQFTDSELRALANAPLPPGVDWSLLSSIDFENASIKKPSGGRPASRR